MSTSYKVERSVVQSTEVGGLATMFDVKGAGEAAAGRVKTELLGGAEAAHDTLKKLGDLISANADAIDSIDDQLSDAESVITDIATTKINEMVPTLINDQINYNTVSEMLDDGLYVTDHLDSNKYVFKKMFDECVTVAALGNAYSESDDTAGYGTCIVMHDENTCLVFDMGNDKATANEGSTYTGYGSTLMNYLKSKNIDKVDAVFISHYHSDHYQPAALKTLRENFDVGYVVLPHTGASFTYQHGGDCYTSSINSTTGAVSVGGSRNNTYNTIKDYCKFNENQIICPNEEGVTVTVGDSINPFGNFTVRCYNVSTEKFNDYYDYKLNEYYSPLYRTVYTNASTPQAEYNGSTYSLKVAPGTNYNNFSMINVVEVFGKKIVVTGDIMEPAIRANMDILSSSDILFVPHHGLDLGLPSEAFNNLSAKYAIINSAYDYISLEATKYYGRLTDTSRAFVGELLKRGCTVLNTYTGDDAANYASYTAHDAILRVTPVNITVEQTPSYAGAAIYPSILKPRYNADYTIIKYDANDSVLDDLPCGEYISLYGSHAASYSNLLPFTASGKKFRLVVEPASFSGLSRSQFAYTVNTSAVPEILFRTKSEDFDDRGYWQPWRAFKTSNARMPLINDSDADGNIIFMSESELNQKLLERMKKLSSLDPDVFAFKLSNIGAYAPEGGIDWTWTAELVKTGEQWATLTARCGFGDFNTIQKRCISLTRLDPEDPTVALKPVAEWQDFEFIDVPIYAGCEFRTAENFLARPVYTKIFKINTANLVDNGDGTKSFNLDIEASKDDIVWNDATVDLPQYVTDAKYYPQLIRFSLFDNGNLVTSGVSINRVADNEDGPRFKAVFEQDITGTNTYIQLWYAYPYTTYVKDENLTPPTPEPEPSEPEMWDSESKTLSNGVKNVLLNAKQVIDIPYTPLATLPRKYKKLLDGTEDTFTANVEQHGIPYSSSRLIEGFVPNFVSFETFMTALQNPNSYLYTVSDVGDTSDKPSRTYYGTVCSAFCSYVLGFEENYPSNSWSTLTDITKIHTNDELLNAATALADIQIGDLFIDEGNYDHVQIVTDVYRETATNKVLKVIVAEAVVPTAQYTRFESIGDLNTNLQNGKYGLFRYTKIDEVAHTASIYSPDTYDRVTKVDKPTITYRNELIPRKGDKALWPMGVIELDAITSNFNNADDYNVVRLYKYDYDEVDGDDNPAPRYVFVEGSSKSLSTETSETEYGRLISYSDLEPGRYRARLAHTVTEKTSDYCYFYIIDTKVELSTSAADGTDLESGEVRVTFSSRNRERVEPLFIKWTSTTSNGTYFVQPLTEKEKADGEAISKYKKGTYNIRVAFRFNGSVIHSEIKSITVK